MPNWIEGTLKIRGNNNNVRSFIENGLKPCAGIYENDPGHFVQKISDDGYFIAANTYVDNSIRMFIADDCEIYLFEDINFVYYLPIKQAWGFELSDFVYISKTYNLDLRITGFERGMCFDHEIEVINGVVTIDKSNDYNDYEWECPCPTLGG